MMSEALVAAALEEKHSALAENERGVISADRQADKVRAVLQGQTWPLDAHAGRSIARCVRRWMGAGSLQWTDYPIDCTGWVTFIGAGAKIRHPTSTPATGSFVQREIASMAERHGYDVTYSATSTNIVNGRLLEALREHDARAAARPGTSTKTASERLTESVREYEERAAVRGPDGEVVRRPTRAAGPDTEGWAFP